MQRIWLGDNIVLTLVIGDIRDTLQNMSFNADAWFLDGFAPTRNPQMWGEDIFKQIARLSKDSVKIATYSVSTIVRQGLISAGFEIKICEGFGAKRERLEAYFAQKNSNIIDPQTRKSAIIIGGGIAGSCVAHALGKRGINHVIIDNDKDGETKASNNPAGLIMPRLDKIETKATRFFRAAFLYSVQTYVNLKAGFKQNQIIEYPKHARDSAKFAALKENPPLDDDVLSYVDNALNHLVGGIVYPNKLLPKLMQNTKIIDANVVKITRRTNDQWSALNKDGVEIASAEICIIACGAGLPTLIEMPIKAIDGRAGTINFSPKLKLDNFNAYGGKSYCLPFEEGVVFGATFTPWPLSENAIIGSGDISENLENLGVNAPEIKAQIDRETLKSRASMRVVTKDFIPIIGPLPHEGPDLYLVGGLGSRGFGVAPMAGEIIASMINDEPMPLENDLLKLIAADRFNKN